MSEDTQARAEVPALDQEKEDLKAQIVQLQADLLAAQDDRDAVILKSKKAGQAALGDAREWKKKHDLLSDSVEMLTSNLNSANEHTCDGDHVNIDDVKHEIIWRSTVKDLVYEGYHKRNVPEDGTVIVIRKTGG